MASKIPSIIHMNWVKECKAYMYFFIAAGYLKEGNKLSSFSNLSSTFHSLLTWIPTKFSCILNYCWYLIRKGLYWWLHHWSWATYTLHCILKKTKKILNLQHHLFRISCYEDIKQHDRWHVTILLHLCAFLNLKDENLMNENVKKLSIKVVFLQFCVVRCTEVDKKVTNKRFIV